MQRSRTTASLEGRVTLSDLTLKPSIKPSFWQVDGLRVADWPQLEHRALPWMYRMPGKALACSTCSLHAVP